MIKFRDLDAEKCTDKRLEQLERELEELRCAKISPSTVAEVDDEYTERRIQAHTVKPYGRKYQFSGLGDECMFCKAKTETTEISAGECGYFAFRICPDCLRAMADVLENSIRQVEEALKF